MKITNFLAKGILDTDSDERLIENGKLVDAENFIVTSSSSGNQGVGKSVLGNVKKTNYEIEGAKTIGKAVNTSEEKIYNFIKGSNFDFVMEYDKPSGTSSVVLQSTTGGALNFISGERILNADIIIDPEGNGNLLKWSGDSNPPRIINIERAKTWGLNGFTAEEIMQIKAPPAKSLTAVSLLSTENSESNNLEDRFVTFLYRWRYKDGYYSCVSTYTKYIFTPGNFDLDFDSFENKGMLSIFNAVNLTFNTGPREVVGVDVLFKLSNDTSIYIIDKFIKEDEEWPDNTNQSILFDNSKVYTVLPVEEYFRSFDNVPHIVKASTVAGNRSMDSNYTEGYDLIDKNGNKVVMDYALEVVSNNITGTDIPTNDISATYTFEGSPVIIANGNLLVSFTGIEFKKGSVIFISFDIESNDQEISFLGLFSYVIEDDYTDLTDFFTNSGFAESLSVNYTAYFELNGGIVEPDNTVDYEILQGFLPTIAGPTLLSIKFPVIKYEINNSPDPNTFIYDYYFNNSTMVSYRNIGVTSSLKSRRSYEICMIYRDLQCRKTTALTSTNNTVFIPNEKAITQNQIQVNIPLTQLPPVWAKTYKFGIKVNKGIYQQIIASIFFIDEEGYRWIKLDGENKNKVKENDILIVKKDSSRFISEVVKVKVLEIKEQPKDFLEDNTDDNDQPIVEPAGLYMKIRPTNFEINYDPREFQRFSDSASATNVLDYPFILLGGLWEFNGTTYDPIPLNQGSTVDLNVFAKRQAPDDFTEYSRPPFTVQDNYASFEDWFNAEVTTPLNGSDENFETEFVTIDDQRYLKIISPYRKSGASGSFSAISGTLNIRSVDGYFIFETEPIEIDNGVFYETPEVFDVIDGEHEMEEHLLIDTFNCYAFGNGAESYQIRDSMTAKYLSIDFCPTAVSEDEYRRINRYADITYSGIYDSNTNVNKLNVYNLFLANFKDDIEKKYGSVQKIIGKETNLEVYQEDRVSIVYYGKDLLYNADGTTNLSKIEQVLGQQNIYAGEYGISAFPEGNDTYGLDDYWADPKRGVMLKKSNNGIFEISSQGMRAYFKKMFRDNRINRINTAYDQFLNVAVFNIQYNDTEYVTWLYSDKDNGWLCTQKFNPEAIIRLNNELYSFKNGDVYLHNQDKNGVVDNYNTFYGVQSPSKFSIYLNEEVVSRKNFFTFEIDGIDPWNVTAETNLNKGYANAVDFVKEEGIWRAYIRGNNSVVDLASLSVQGIGNAVSTSLVLDFDFEIDSFVSIGDNILNQTAQLVGTIISKTSNSLTLDAVNNFTSGQFVLCAKNQSVENSSLVGNAMKVNCELETNRYTEVFSISSEVNKSYV